MISPYCSLVYADTINSSDSWTSASDEDKQVALSYGRLYIDKYYNCSDSSYWDSYADIPDYTDIPEEVQLANAKLADLHLQGDLLQDSPYSGKIVRKLVKAGKVSTETEYQGARAQYYGARFNELEDISLLLSGECTFGASSRNVIRV